MGYSLNLSEFSLEKITSAKREIIFDILTNYENYSKLFPQHFPSIRIRSERDNASVVEEHMILGEKELVIMAKHVIREPTTHEIFVIGGDAKGTHITQQFIEIPQGTKILVNVDLNLKGIMKISGLFGKNKFEEHYSNILDDFVRIAEN